jgi:hypothetical protein
VSEPKPKSFAISKWAVWEAYRRVKANQGAAGVEEQSIAGFEEDLHPEVLRQRSVGPHAEGGSPPHRPALDPALRGAVAQSAAATRRREPGRAGSRDPAGLGDLTLAGQHVHACVS